ncbi:MAG: TIGR02452 family protein [Planctomycetes bacterium]|nr:TIGR02452 family protein [Planctomycetota bacterium]
MGNSRSRAAEVARDTVESVVAGRYRNAAGAKVPIRHLVEAACNGTVSYPPGAPLPNVVPSDRATAFAVVNDTTLSAARQLAAEGANPVALNFASARHPGGGFLNGARAQEESLCRASALYECINGNAMYRHHAAQPGGFYTNSALYSPAVPVFKDDDGDPLDAPYLCAFVTAPAVNAGVFTKEHKPGKRASGTRDLSPAEPGFTVAPVRDEMADRIEKVLTIMAGHGHAAAVLGAWGCGVFRNDPEMIAELFAHALRGRFAGAFAKVVFAVLDTGDGETIRPFAERFG